ncbi:MAG TPA: glycosyltransferase family 4 protein [Burkholderiales bacterium]|nr:glycosyltransferase family 4 protein [Burkholderiales bacterium]
MKPSRIRTLVFSTLYPNAVKPGHGIFVETRLRHLLSSGEIEAKVVAPVPWFPLAGERFGKYAAYAKVPKRENRDNINIFHPRYPVLPKIGMSLAPISMAAACMPILSQLIKSGRDFDLIDAHYFYPDGVAAAFLGRQLGKPVVITARGTDVNLIPEYRIPRKMILWAASQAAGIITVSTALKERLVEIGVDPAKITVLRNGVDLERFSPMEKAAQRAELNLPSPLLLSVGNLVESKGHDLAIRSLSLMPDKHLAIVGEGPEKENLQLLARSTGVKGRVEFLGSLPQKELPRYYSAADALVLASSREGWANVLLEAMACGTPVIASRVGGNPEVVASDEAGVLMDERTPEGIAEAAGRLFLNYPEAGATRRYAEQFSWHDTTTGQLKLFSKILGR